MPNCLIRLCQVARFGTLDCPFGRPNGPFWVAQGALGLNTLGGGVSKLFTPLLNATQVVIEALRREPTDEKRKYCLRNFYVTDMHRRTYMYVCFSDMHCFWSCLKNNIRILMTLFMRLVPYLSMMLLKKLRWGKQLTKTRNA